MAVACTLGVENHPNGGTVDTLHPKILEARRGQKQKAKDDPNRVKR